MKNQKFQTMFVPRHWALVTEIKQTWPDHHLQITICKHYTLASHNMLFTLLRAEDPTPSRVLLYLKSDTLRQRGSRVNRVSLISFP